MTFDEYTALAMRTDNQSLDWSENIQHASFMLASEVGEVLGPYQKFFFQGHDVPKPEETAKELGDILWALNKFAYMIGYSLEEIAEINIEKLRKRYGEAFTEEASLNRDEYS